MPERRADAVVSRARRLDRPAASRGSSPGCTSSIRTRPTSRRSSTCGEYAAQPYYGEVAFVDRALGAAASTRLATLSRPTLVIVTADHGESLGEHGELTHGMFAYEATLHVPLIVARVDPGQRAPAGVVIDTPVRHIDIVPDRPRGGRRAGRPDAARDRRCGR